VQSTEVDFIEVKHTLGITKGWGDKKTETKVGQLVQYCLIGGITSDVYGTAG
jgi:hypothetical protein